MVGFLWVSVDGRGGAQDIWQEPSDAELETSGQESSEAELEAELEAEMEEAETTEEDFMLRVEGIFP